MSNWEEKGKIHQQIEEHMEKGQFKKALKSSQKLLKLDPNDCDTLFNMSRPDRSYRNRFFLKQKIHYTQVVRRKIPYDVYVLLE